MKALLTGAVAAFVFSASVVTASQVIYSNSFEKAENAAYDPNASVVGVDYWTLSSTAGSAVIATDNPAAGKGTQFVRLSDQAVLNRSFPENGDGSIGANTGTVWVEGYFRGVGSNSTLAAADYGATDASAIVHFSAANGIELLNGDGAGSGTAVRTTVTTLEETAWYKITIRLNFDTKKWDVWINDNQTAAYKNLGFRNNTVTRLGGFKNLAQQRADFDGFRIVKPRVGDSNGDATNDAADIVATVQNLFATDPIVQNNGDVDHDGDVDTADVDLLTSQLTAK